MTASKIILFLGSTRQGRMGGKVANYVQDVLQKKGLETKIFDPLEMNFPMLREPLHFMKDKSQAPQWMLDADEEIQNADGFVVVLPEYNCSLPPALSNMMDHFPPSSYRHRPCSIVVYSMGDFGGIRSNLLVQPFLNELGMVPLPSRVVVPTVQKKFDENQQPTCERLQNSVDKMTTELSWYVDALRNHKKEAGNPTA